MTPPDRNVRISVLVPAMRGYESVLPAIEAWERQTARQRIEILVLHPRNLGPPEVRRATLPVGLVPVDIGTLDVHEARALAIERATGEYVMLAEDHCLPDPDWAAAMIQRLEEGWDAAGSALRPGCRTTPWAEASFLIGYGEWMEPVAGGATRVISGSNGTIRRRVLRELGGDLPGQLLLGAFLVRNLERQGHRFCLEKRARMRHFDPPGAGYEILLLAIVGMGFGAMRTRDWPLPARLLYPLASPAVAFLHGKRAWRQYRRAGVPAGMGVAAMAAAAVLAMAWGFGEGVGALLRVARVTPFIWRSEVKPVGRAEVAVSDARERG
jgi:hypothetical protein